MTREEALERLKVPAYDPDKIERDEYIATKLDITVEELRGYYDALTRPIMIIDPSRESILWCSHHAAAWLRTRWQAMIGIVDYGLGNVQVFANYTSD